MGELRKRHGAYKRMVLNFGGVPQLFPQSRLEDVGIGSKKATQRILSLPLPGFVHEDGDEVTISGDTVFYQFTAAADKEIWTTFEVPPDYDGGALTLRIYWYYPVADAGNDIRFNILTNVKRVGVDITTLTSYEDQYLEDTTAAALLLRCTEHNLFWGVYDVRAGDILEIKIERTGTHADDNSAALARVHAITLQYRGA